MVVAFAIELILLSYYLLYMSEMKTEIGFGLLACYFGMRCTVGQDYVVASLDFQGFSSASYASSWMGTTLAGWNGGFRPTPDGISFDEARSAGNAFREGESAGIAFGEARQTEYRQKCPRQTRFRLSGPRQTENRLRGPRQTEFQQNGPRQTQSRQTPDGRTVKTVEMPNKDEPDGHRCVVGSSQVRFSPCGSNARASGALTRGEAHELV